jgi:hypothetical protein
LSRKSKERERKRLVKQHKDYMARLGRTNTEEWYPTADELTLPDVPAEYRERIRSRIAPWIASMRHVDDDERIPIKIGDCWHIAQAFVLTAASPDVKYVEGVWNPLRNCASDQCECCREPKPHGWATVEGFVICLPSEFLRWQGDVNRYSLYEPTNEYTYEDIVESVAMGSDGRIRSWDILSMKLCDFPPFDGDYNDDQAWENYVDAQSEYAFKSAVERFKARHQSEEVFAYA